MGFSKPSVSRAIGLLKKGEYITVDSDGYITLTESGAEVAHKMYDRHRLLTDFLISLGVSEEIASADACKIEHHISDESFEAIKKSMGK
jgi:Mn-dependent DtxR family transcriptional regulator